MERASLSTLDVSGGVVSDGDQLLALNRPATEDEAAPRPTSALAELFGDVDVVTADASGASTRDDGGLLEEIWRVFMALALIGLLAEALLCVTEGDALPIVDDAEEAGVTASIALLQSAADGARLELHVSPGFAWIAAGVLVLAVSLSARAWLRSHRRGSILALEVVRLVLVTAVLFVLAQPEWVVTETPDEAPLVTVLWDDSGSMETRDVEGPDGLVARADVVRARIAEIEGLRWRRARAPRASRASNSWPRRSRPPRARTGTRSRPRKAPASEPTCVRPSRRCSTSARCGPSCCSPTGTGTRAAAPSTWRRATASRGSRSSATVRSPTRLPDIALAPVDPPAFAIVDRPVDLPISIDSAMPGTSRPR